MSASQPQDTTYTQQAAMMVYDYDPIRALQVIDSAVIVGNLSPWWADKCRMRIYSQTRAGDRLDSLMQWPLGTRLDSARAIGERLLRHDSIKGSLEGQQDVLEMLAYAARRQNDSTAWLQWSRQLVDVCRRQGAETEALRNEAEVGAALCWMGQQREGMEMLDSAIDALQQTLPQPLPVREGSDYTQDGKSAGELSTPSLTGRAGGGSFNELDALVVALKRKIGVMTAHGQSAEVLPLARRIVTLMDDYEQRPDQYHDDSYREPPAEKHDDYIRFYRSQAENFITTAYAALVESADMNTTFERLENIVREADTREHQSRYAALEQQMQRQEAEARAERSRLVTVIFAILLAAALAALVWYWWQRRIVSRKNRVLVRQISESLDYKQKYEQLETAMSRSAQNTPSAVTETNAQAQPDLEQLSDADLFLYLSHAIRHEQLYLSPQFGRQTLMDRFHLSDRRIGAAFKQGNSHRALPDFIRNLRLDYACQLLRDHPEMPIADVAESSGFSSIYVFSSAFKKQNLMTPTEFRQLNASLEAGGDE